ncbi:hypothetical protein J2X65_001120 [Ancylobacter sp. 3268]|uniref:hypothetical protein n=1 Tax=Ancylobacter sp. 3268 TaxID=2817752 RepID=UPI00285A96CE|nr:hypothetical protein [Ancylobacter sp. 3268]MDR6951771.1 hypothetical protein [Ancylobacter sp. 3268]
MSAVRNRAEERVPAALRQPAAALKTVPRAVETSAEKQASNVPPAPIGSIAAIETQLGF